MGLNQKDIVNVKDLENDLLGLRERLIPLQTSYTESGSSTGNGAGRPSLPDDQKSDKTIRNIQSQGAGEDGGNE